MTADRAQIAVVGDFDRANPTHKFTNAALEHVALDFTWVPTDSSGDWEERLAAYDQKTHEGYDWIYVLSGRVRLVLGDQDFVLKEGEVAEFDTRVPHWFSNPGPGPTEVLCLYGPQGERMHVRARTR